MKTLGKSTLFLFMALATPAMAESKGGEHMLEKLDQDKDGKVSEVEFLESKKERFKEADKNSDGFLDSAEITELKKNKRDKMKKMKQHDNAEKDD